MSKKKIMTRKTALIIIIMILILAITAIFLIVKNNQKEYKYPPELSVILEDGTEIKMLRTYYDWNYEGENVIFKLDRDIQTYNFPKENVIYTSTESLSKAKIKSDVKYITTLFTSSYAKIENNSIISHSTSNSHGDFSRILYKGKKEFKSHADVGEYVYTFRIDYKNQGYATYAIKVINFSEADSKIAKEYLNTSLENLNKIKELVSKIEFNTFLKDVNINEKNLNLKYEYYISDNILKMNNLILFACIPDLETITYTAEHKKTFLYNEEKERTPQEIDNVVYTREQINSNDTANIENFMKYMESL